MNPPAGDSDDPCPPGYCHFPAYTEEYFKQLTAEELVTRIVKGYRKPEWQKTRERNEALDCRVYARAAAAVCGMDRFKDETWSRLENNLVELAKPDEQPSPAPPAPAPRQPRIRGYFDLGRGGSWFDRW